MRSLIPLRFLCCLLLQVCTQQSALSNHMRTHEPKKHKCDICGRSFGLFIRLAGHRITEHNEQPMMSPALSAVEQEEALNAEREAREAREAKTRGVKKSYTEVCHSVSHLFLIMNYLNRDITVYIIKSICLYLSPWTCSGYLFPSLPFHLSGIIFFPFKCFLLWGDRTRNRTRIFLTVYALSNPTLHLLEEKLIVLSHHIVIIL